MCKKRQLATLHMPFMFSLISGSESLAFFYHNWGTQLFLNSWYSLRSSLGFWTPTALYPLNLELEMRLVMDGGNANRHNKLDQFLRVISTSKANGSLILGQTGCFFQAFGRILRPISFMINDVSRIIAALLMNGILFVPLAPQDLLVGVIYLGIVSAKQHPSRWAFVLAEVCCKRNQKDHE